MKITSVEAIPVSLPLGKPIRMAGAEVATSQNVIVRVEADGALVGWGECAAAPSFSGETQASILGAIRSILAPLLVGEDPLRREALHLAMDRRLAGNVGAKTALDIALFDLAGRALGAPAYDLLGGRTRDRIRLFWHLANADPQADAREAEAKGREGFTFFKLKVGTSTIQRDVEAALQVREAIGKSADLAADANQAWGVPEALRFLRGAEEAHLCFFEQPVPAEDVRGMAALARTGGIPILADEGIFSATDILMHDRQEAAQIVSVKLLKAGGLTGALRAVHAAEAVRLPLHLTGKVAESSIATAALLHLAAAVRELHFGCGVTNHYLLEDLVAEPLQAEKGHLLPPDGPGLGITVDEAQVRRLQTSGY